MGITYRQNHGKSLSVGEMDGNFHYIEQELATATASLAMQYDDITNLETNLAIATASLVMQYADITNLETNVAGLTASVMMLEDDVMMLQSVTGVTHDFKFLVLVGGVTHSGTFSFTNGILATYSLV
jgi:hypothetical protein